MFSCVLVNFMKCADLTVTFMISTPTWCFYVIQLSCYWGWALLLMEQGRADRMLFTGCLCYITQYQEVFFWLYCNIYVGFKRMKSETWVWIWCSKRPLENHKWQVVKLKDISGMPGKKRTFNHAKKVKHWQKAET